ncbi:carbon-nitrogen family hydrolase [Paenibacillus crassostreae]|uniref:Nitrilase n=1 Tax=Paenibacillus crassostreae TaxID=1763538 RepID=A0A167DMA3_9BACL|nr:carbon-nitrogen family hydrolase [Paenibacillus crassostreae]AOZ91285.1 carbon-nitrogen hydrolase [Paenibacillus crassostreae]OAB74556.1 nitrilase [Paenibacillus crassostreae]
MVNYADKRNLQIALIQMSIHIGEPDLNERHVTSLMEEAVTQNPKVDILVLPELWNTGYALDKLREIADAGGEYSKGWLSSFAKKHQVMIVAGSIAESNAGQVSNTMYVFDQQGEVIANYSKIHLFRLMNEEKYIVPGQQLVTFDVLPECRAGVAICYDIRFPEMARSLALNGAEILFIPAEWPHPRLHHWRTLLMARAIENQMYVIACNTVGGNGDTTFFGHSMIIDPWGEVVVEGGESEEIIIGEVTLSLIAEVRNRIPIYRDRRPELY